MFAEQDHPLENIQDFFPPVCTEEPANNSAFCASHSKFIQSCGYPTNIRDFLKACGADPSHYTKAGKEKVKAVLRDLMNNAPAEMKTQTPEMSQGTSYLLRNREVTNQENFQFDFDGERCSKNTGELHRLHNWSRGIFEIVGSGGFIEYWSPIYNSENPHQAAFIMIKYLGMKMQGKTQADMKRFWLSYEILGVTTLTFLPQSNIF